MHCGSRVTTTLLEHTEKWLVVSFLLFLIYTTGSKGLFRYSRVLCRVSTSATPIPLHYIQFALALH